MPTCRRGANKRSTQDTGYLPKKNVIPSSSQLFPVVTISLIRHQRSVVSFLLTASAAAAAGDLRHVVAVEVRESDK